MSNGSPPTLIDTMVFSNFAAVGRLALLQERWTPLYMAQAVYEELRNGLAEGYVFLAAVEEQSMLPYADAWLHVIALEGIEEVALYEKMPTRLHPGEAESLAIARQRGWNFLTDDKLARRWAGQAGVRILGTLGILAELVREGVLQLEEANELLTQMRVQARYYAPVTDIAIIMEDSGEE